MNRHRRFLLAVVVAVAVISAAGFCLVHAESGGPDVCNGLIGVAVAPLAVVLLGSGGRVRLGADRAYVLSPLDLASPPPRA